MVKHIGVRTAIVMGLMLCIFAAMTVITSAAEKQDQTITGVKDTYTVNAYKGLTLKPKAKTPITAKVSDTKNSYYGNNGYSNDPKKFIARRTGTYTVTFTAKENDKYKAAEKVVTIKVKNGWNSRKSGLALDSDYRELQVSFYPNPNATKYRIYYKKKSSKKWKHKDVSQAAAEKYWKQCDYYDPYHSIKKLKNNCKYTVKLKVYTKSGKSAYARNSKGKVLKKTIKVETAYRVAF